ncbi:MAG TPA: hypothetical protein PKG48_10310 [Bacteroidales bacterium]|mgnify:CR=1 FL=1|nr:hypothetical protein [Bacteroidales bacterium]HPS61816.1 hypothetical protein [Bacteroidales bacterium]
MEKKDPIEEKFSASFENFEADPPEEVWENVKLGLQAERMHSAWWSRFHLIALLHKSLGFYLAVSGITVAVTFSLIVFGPGRRHDIRGHVYAGGLRMKQGTATLFRSEDLAMPWDSLTYQRSAVVDEYGHFRFFRVPEGNYLVRLTPDPVSEAAKSYLPSWYDRSEVSDSAKRITIAGNNLTIEVHLKKR